MAVAPHDAELARARDAGARGRRRVEQELGPRHAPAHRDDAARRAPPAPPAESPAPRRRPTPRRSGRPARRRGARSEGSDTVPTTPGRDAPFPSSRSPSASWRASARRRNSSRSRASRSLRRRAFSSRARKSSSVEPTALEAPCDSAPTAAATGAEAVRIHDWSTDPRPPRAWAWAERTSTQATRTITSTAPPRRGLAAAISAWGFGDLMTEGRAPCTGNREPRVRRERGRSAVHGSRFT